MASKVAAEIWVNGIIIGALIFKIKKPHAAQISVIF
jgi:hypothetical protein